MQRDDRIRLRHMIEAAEDALRFVDGRARADLDSDRMLLFAVVRAVEIVGEAASKMSPLVRADQPTIPWSAIIAMPNRLVHAYFEIDTDIVWVAVQKEMPALLLELKSIAE